MQTHIPSLPDAGATAFPLWCEFNEPDDLPDEYDDEDEFDDDEFVTSGWKKPVARISRSLAACVKNP